MDFGNILSLLQERENIKNENTFCHPDLRRLITSLYFGYHKYLTMQSTKIQLNFDMCNAVF